MIIKEVFGIIAAAIVFMAYIPYLRGILKNTIKPHPVSWLVWAITTFSVLILQIQNGSGSGAYMTAVVFVFIVGIFIASLKRSRIKISLLDTACLLLAVAGIGIWLFIHNPTLSIVVLFAVEMIGFIPTLREGWRKPREESLLMWSLSGSRHSLSLAAVQSYNFITLAYPLAWAFVAFSFCSILLVRRMQLPKKVRRAPKRPRVQRYVPAA